MTEIVQIERMTAAADDDLLVIYDTSAQRTYSVTRADFLADVLRNLPSMTYGSETVAVPAIAASSSATVVVTITGAAVGSSVTVSFDGGLPSGVVANAHVSATGSVTITFANVATTASTAASKVARITAWALS